MSDISKCTGKECELKEYCYRYLAKNNYIKQSWLIPMYDKKKKDCANFWKATRNRIKQ